MLEKQYELKGTIADFLTEYRLGEAVYLATPYSGHPNGTEWVYAAAKERAWDMMDKRVAVFAPIVHSHRLVGLPKTHDFWMKMDVPLLLAIGKAGGWLVVDPLGTDWRDSKGVSTEVEEARKRGIRIFWLED